VSARGAPARGGERAASEGPLLLGIDVGTGGSKAILIDAGGAVLARATTEYPLHAPRPLWSEQDPEGWWRATAASVRRAFETSGAAPSSVAAVGLTGQMHGLVLLDARDRVLRPAILWNDQRTSAQCGAIHDHLGAERVLAIAGKPALTGFTAPKILWVREHERETYSRARGILLPKDFVRFRLTGERASDVADASGTLLFDVRARTWSDEMLDALDVPRAWLPAVSESPQVVARVTAEGAAATGLAPGTPVVAGAGDQAAEAVGCGVVEGGAVSVTIGTSGVVFAATGELRLDRSGRLHAYCHAVPGTWHVMGVMLSAGGSLRWFRDVLGAAIASGAAYDDIAAAAATVPPGCEGLTFLPYLTGERTPHADPEARGAFVGLTLRHGAAHLARAVMEGVTFGLLDALTLTRELGIAARRVRVSGGGARSALWRGMMADVFGAEVATVNVAEGAAFGAAILAAVGAGLHASVPAAASAIIAEGEITRPGPDARRFARAGERYRALYPALHPVFRAIGAGDAG
jgi:xylulokinase